jgi:anti-sigma-K factor RskA
MNGQHSYRESGILELYVYGLLDHDENSKIRTMAREDSDLANEIESVEQAVMALSAGFAPELSPDRYEKIRRVLNLTEESQPIIIETEEKKRRGGVWGWLVAGLLLLGGGYLFYEYTQLHDRLYREDLSRQEVQSQLDSTKVQLRQSDETIAMLKETAIVINLEPQPAAPESSVRMFWTPDNDRLVVDASSLSEAPEGQTYQVWGFYRKPFRTESIGTLPSTSGLQTLEYAEKPHLFAITLEPVGGSESPTLEQLCAMGPTP